MQVVEDPRTDTAVASVTVIGSLLACTSGALVAVQVSLWFAGSVAGGLVPRTLWVSLLMSAGMLVLGAVMFVTSLALLAQRHPSTFGRRTSAWAAVGFVAMAAWALGIPMLLQV
jgi:hypothetical protein